MPVPATIDELLDVLRKSQVLESGRLVAFVERWRTTAQAPANPRELGTAMVREGMLTPFQAEHLLQGKWRHFNISGKYKVLEQLGAGGMGRVYLCQHTHMNRLVAIKVLPGDKAEDPAVVQRFYREAKAVAALDHPNIVRAHDIDQEGDIHFLVLEHVAGSNLQQLVERDGPLPIPRAVDIIRQAAAGLQHAHEKGLIHRDIKPSNLLIDGTGTVKVLDLGLARFFQDEQDNLTSEYDGQAILGTADYIAPEQAVDSHQADIRADIYSLGATFYFLLTGSKLFPEGTLAQKLLFHQVREPKPVRELRPEVPEAVAAILTRMLNKWPEQRYQTPAEVVADLATLTGLPLTPAEVVADRATSTGPRPTLAEVGADLTTSTGPRPTPAEMEADLTTSTDPRPMPTRRRTLSALLAAGMIFLACSVALLAYSWLGTNGTTGPTGAMAARPQPVRTSAAASKPQPMPVPTTLRTEPDPPNLYEAEEAELSGKSVVEKGYPGYTGRGYVRLRPHSGLIFSAIRAAVDGPATLTFRYALGGTGRDCPVELVVNGARVNPDLVFAKTGSNSKWLTVKVTVSLTAGNNKVELRNETENHGPQIDSLKMSP